MNVSDWFERKTRGDGSTFYSLREVDGQYPPDWLHDAVRDAHDDEMPNDWRYDTIHSIVLALEDGSDRDEIADSLVDVYTSDLIGWLAGNTSRLAYVDDAAAEWATDCDTVEEQIRIGQMYCISQMVNILADAIDENTGDDES